MSIKPTIDHKEIARLVGSRPDNVKSSIKRLVARGAIQQPHISCVKEINSLGFFVKREVYVFEGEQLIHDVPVVLARLCKEFTPKLPPYLNQKATLLQLLGGK
ncbi:hypothetical protein [Yersinia pseudotuberculosis]|uniref:hypothetical protein n=1 Tax=Yersinia pseudotuberculosis TaxID=633 RepID=UPI00061B8CFA|nr:hypothetical protein [Yersinia pseudotuberculosis]AXY34577.1 hypothetical protein CEQ20_15050 [Yersinia pseudotuberculosis]AYX10239.1 hypothetical protein EGX52_05115 [Yersinia pseudotuberculosis]PEI14144.1 hypothetical protein CRM78_13480 [Yersinia pseudotuberculosis]CNJ20937.1 putative DNA-binding protein (Roi) [Yersinia pseudotuberculosis]CNJ77682.1 putative DNA-binding protein (Roi) [Yersinia pseudotuberculosis]